MKEIPFDDLLNLLEDKYRQYNTRNFITDDPVQIPHLFSSKEDIEISAFLTAILAWGKRDQIIKHLKKLMEWMDFDPYHFIISHQVQDLTTFNKFYYRTFNGIDCVFFLKSLQNLYLNHQGLQGAFYDVNSKSENVKNHIINFRKLFFSIPHVPHSEKHISDPLKNSACKRINLFLRWMVRKDNRGVDFGLWNHIKPDQLICPLDVHTARVARKLGLIGLMQDNWKAAHELTENLKMFDKSDPVKYDFALFGLGIFENF